MIGSFSVLASVAVLSNPQQSIATIPLFFVMLWLVIFSFLWLLGVIFFSKGRNNLKTHLSLITTAIVLFLMLKSTGEIRPADAAVLILLIAGLAFYINRR